MSLLGLHQPGDTLLHRLPASAKLLGLTLTSRNNGGAADVPLAGVPAHTSALDFLRGCPPLVTQREAYGLQSQFCRKLGLNVLRRSAAAFPMGWARRQLPRCILLSRQQPLRYFPEHNLLPFCHFGEDFAHRWRTAPDDERSLR